MRRRRTPFGLLVIACVAALAVTVTFVGSGAFAGVSQSTTARTANNQPLTPAQKRAAAKKAAARRAAAKRLAARRAAAAAAAARRAYKQPAAVYARGKTLFKQNCASCHTLSAANAHGHVGPDLDGASVSFGDVTFMVTNGNGLMPGRGPSGTLTDAQIHDIATFVSKASQ